MTEVGRRPTLDEIRQALHAICSVEADVNALDRDSKTFRVVLTFNREDCPQDWIDGQPKPTGLFEQIVDELAAWAGQRIREQQWVSKEEQFGSSINGLIEYYYDELKKQSSAVPSTMHTRMQTRILSETIVRLQELKERRQAGGVYSQTESRREKARKIWAEDEYEALKREEEQRKKQERRDEWENWLWRQFRDTYNADFERMFEDIVYRRGNTFREPPPTKPSNNKRPWNVVLGVSIGATKEQIKKAHRKLVARHQPRTSADAEDRARAEKMMEINTARDEGLAGL